MNPTVRWEIWSGRSARGLSKVHRVQTSGRTVCGRQYNRADAYEDARELVPGPRCRLCFDERGSGR